MPGASAAPFTWSLNVTRLLVKIYAALKAGKQLCCLGRAISWHASHTHPQGVLSATGTYEGDKAVENLIMQS